MSEATVIEKRRQLLDAIYAIHAGDGLIRVDVGLAHRLQIAWNEYDATLTDRLRAALVRYGEHETGCVMGDHCNCGLLAAIGKGEIDLS